MGMYTEIYVNVNLVEDCPVQAVDVLKAMCGEGDESALAGRPERWAYLFNSGSYYTPNTQCKALTWDEIGNQYSLLGKGDIKNYEDEIEQFFAWLRPFVEGEKGDFIGYMRYEESREPTLIYL